MAAAAVDKRLQEEQDSKRKRDRCTLGENKEDPDDKGCLRTVDAIAPKLYYEHYQQVDGNADEAEESPSEEDLDEEEFEDTDYHDILVNIA